MHSDIFSTGMVRPLIVSITKRLNMIGCQQPLFMAQFAVSGPNCPIWPVRLRTFVIGKANRTVKQQIKNKHFINFNYLTYPSRSKSRKTSSVSRLTGADCKQTWTKFTALMTRTILFIIFIKHKLTFSWLCFDKKRMWPYSKPLIPEFLAFCYWPN